MKLSTRSQIEPTRCHTDWGLRSSPWDCRQPEGSRPQRSPPGLWSPAWYRARHSVCVLHALLAPHRPTKQSRDMTLSGPDGSAVSALGLHGRSQIGLLCPAVHSPDQARPGSSRPSQDQGLADAMGGVAVALPASATPDCMQLQMGCRGPLRAGLAVKTATALQCQSSNALPLGLDPTIWLLLSPFMKAASSFWNEVTLPSQGANCWSAGHLHVDKNSCCDSLQSVPQTTIAWGPGMVLWLPTALTLACEQSIFKTTVPSPGLSPKSAQATSSQPHLACALDLACTGMTHPQKSHLQPSLLVPTLYGLHSPLKRQSRPY